MRTDANVVALGNQPLGGGPRLPSPDSLGSAPTRAAVGLTSTTTSRLAPA